MLNSRHKATCPLCTRQPPRGLKTGTTTPRLSSDCTAHRWTCPQSWVTPPWPGVLQLGDILPAWGHPGWNRRSPRGRVSAHQNGAPSWCFRLCPPGGSPAPPAAWRCAGHSETEAPWSSESVTRLVCPGFFHCVIQNTYSYF